MRNPGGKFQWSGSRGAGSQHRAGPTQYSMRVDWSYSRRTDSRTSMDTENQARTIEGGSASGPKDDDDRRVPRPRGIQCYNCRLLVHTRSNCPRVQGKNLNGIGRTKATPPSCPKYSLTRGVALPCQLLRFGDRALLTLDIGGEEFLFMVDTGVMFSLIQPGISKVQLQLCDVQARGETGTQLDILGEQ